MTPYFKSWGGHHIPLALVLGFIFGPVQFLFWAGKELGEATERAGGTKQALSTWSVWEPFDALTPSLAGLIYFWVPTL